MGLAERLAAHVQRRGADECWPWTAHTVGNGYGRLSRGRRGEGEVQAHRAAWELARGPIPAGLCVLHSCDNPPCCNPAHLFLGTHADNMRDAARKGRHARQRLSARDVQTIREAYAAGGVTQSALAARYGITQTHVWRLVHDGGGHVAI